MDYEAKKLVRGRGVTLLLFEAVYKALGSVVVIPFCLWLINASFKAVGISYIAPSNIGYLFYPTVVAAVIAAALIMSVYTLVELASIMTCFEYAYYEKRVGVKTLIVTGLKRSCQALKPRNWGIILFTVLIVPLGSMFLSSGFLGELSIPEYISEVINANPLYSVALSIITVGATLLSLRWLFIFQIFFLEGKTMRESAKDSAAMMKGRYIKIALSFIWWMVKVGIKIALVIGLLAVIAVIPLIAFASSDGIYAILMGVYDISAQVIGFAIAIITLVSSYAWITSRYYIIKSEYGDIDVDKNLVEGRTHTKFMTFAAIVTSLFFIVASSLTAYWIIESGYMFDDEDTSRIQVVAHRGCGLVAPENTLDAYLEAIRQKADYGELDVHWTRDKVVVLSHDDNLKRTGGVDVNIWDIDYDDLIKIDRGGQFSDEFSGVSYSTLDQVMSACKDKLGLIIEIKMDGHDVGIEEDVVKLIREHGYENACYVGSLSYDSLKRVKAIAPDLKTLYFAPFAIGDVEDLAAADAIGIEMTFLSDNMVSRLHDSGKPVFVWTVDDPDHIRKCVDADVDYIISNDPESTRMSIKEDDNDVYRVLLELRDLFLETDFKDILSIE